MPRAACQRGWIVAEPMTLERALVLITVGTIKARREARTFLHAELERLRAELAEAHSKNQNDYEALWRVAERELSEAKAEAGRMREAPAARRICKHCGADAEFLGPVLMWQHCPAHEGGSLTHEWEAQPAALAGHVFVPCLADGSLGCCFGNTAVCHFRGTCGRPEPEHPRPAAQEPVYHQGDHEFETESECPNPPCIWCGLPEAPEPTAPQPAKAAHAFVLCWACATYTVHPPAGLHCSICGIPYSTHPAQPQDAEPKA